MSRDILLSLIDRDETQPRQHFDTTALDELAQSIGASGLAVPILVRPSGERFVIVHGERRYRAALSLGWSSIPADVRDLSIEEAGWLALVENVQRSDLSPIEEARAYQARLASGMTQEALGLRIGKTQSYIATKLRFLKLPADVQEGLDKRLISEGHAKQLLRLDEPEGMSALYADIIRLNSPVREVVEIIDDYWKVRKRVTQLLVCIHSVAVALKAAYKGLGPAKWSWWVHDHIIPHGIIGTEDMAIALMSTADRLPPIEYRDAPEIYLDIMDRLIEDMSRDIPPA